MTFRNWLAMVTAVGALSAFGACGEDEKDGSDDEGGNNCEPGQTFQAVGKPFVDRYCVSCHSADATDRMAAPDDVNFDDIDGIREHGMHVFEEVRDETMPPKSSDAPQPSTDERADFIDWLECEGISELEHEHDH